MKSLTALCKYFALMLVMSMFLCGFQAKKVDTVAVNGMVEKIDKDLKFIVVNEIKMFLSPKTVIMDQKGHYLKPESLKERSNLSVETLCTPDGYVIKKITVETPQKGR